MAKEREGKIILNRQPPTRNNNPRNRQNAQVDEETLAMAQKNLVRQRVMVDTDLGSPVLSQNHLQWDGNGSPELQANEPNDIEAQGSVPSRGEGRLGKRNRMTKLYSRVALALQVDEAANSTPRENITHGFLQVFSQVRSHSHQRYPIQMARTTLLRMLMALIFYGWICLWFLKPTKTWKNIWHELETSLDNTIYSYNGLAFVVYTFPLLVVCMLGQVFLYLQSKEPPSTKPRKASPTFSSAFLIKTPFCLISAFELIPISVFILLLAWTFYAKISRDFMKLMPQKTLKLSIWQLKFYRVVIRSGLLSEVCLSLVLLPILRGLSLLRLIGVQFEASVKYHIWVGTSMIFFATIHGVGTIFIWGTNHKIQSQIWKWQREGRIYLAGGITLLTGLIIWITSLPAIRRRRFHVFYYIHHLYLVFLVFFLFHVGDRHFYMIFSGVLLYGLDKLLRIVQSRAESCILSARILPCKTIELTLPKDQRLKYMPTSIIFIKIPIISRFQWHPFSITSSSTADEHTMSVMIKCEGWWTNALYDTLYKESHLANEQARCIPVAIEGPYGPTDVDFLRYDSLIMVAGGIGVTPFLSILQHFASAKGRRTGQPPSKMQLIYVAKSFQNLSLLHTISKLILNQPADGRWHLKVKVFLTREEKRDSCLRELLSEHSEERRLLFYKNKSNHKIHGPETPLYMAAIVALCSFVFILFLCIFNHYFLDKSKKRPTTIIDLLLVSSFLIALAFCTFVGTFLRRRRLIKENWSHFEKPSVDVQLSNMGLVTSPGQHEVHFVGRPNFKDELCRFEDELEADELGVVVCGPESVKESVALACRERCRAPMVNVRGNNKKKKAQISFHSLNFTL